MDPFANGLHCVYDHRKHSFVPFDQDLSYIESPLSSPISPTTLTTNRNQRADQYEINYWPDPLSLNVPDSANSDDAIDNEVIPVPGHIRRPRNAFMIFRAEFQANNKIDRAVEHDNRHISRIIGHYWGRLTEKEKDVWKVRADQEKVAHMRKYPNYKFTPVLRKDKPVKRKTKRNSEEEMMRCRRVADLLLEGKQGDELVLAINKADGRKPGNIPLEKVSKKAQPEKPTVSACGNNLYLSPFDVFANPLLPPEAMVTRSMLPSTKPPATDSVPQPPTQSPYLAQLDFKKYDYMNPPSPAFISSHQTMSPSPTEDISFKYELMSPMAYDTDYSPDFKAYCASYAGDDTAASTTYSSYRQSPYHSHSPNFAVPAVQMHFSADTHYKDFSGLDSTQPSSADIALADTYSTQRRSSRSGPRNPFHPYTSYQTQYPTALSSNPMASLDTDSIYLHLPEYNVRR